MPQLAEIAADCGVRVRLQALGYGVRGFEDFERGDRHGPYWPGELYRDDNFAVFELALGGRRRAPKSSIVTPAVVGAAVRSTAPAVLTEEKGGDYWNLGGLFITAGRRCVYVERQEKVTDTPSLRPLLSAAKQGAAALQQELGLEQESRKATASEWVAAQVAAAKEGLDVPR
eukprot:COSAG05_NODE_5279_length_1217_cov_1.032200_2_plen_172_part_00